MLKRILPVILTVSVLLCFLIVSASAVTYDYNDYITNISVDGDNDICTVEIPFNGTWIVGTTSSSGSTSYSFYSGNNAHVPLISGTHHSIGVSPFRNQTIWDNSVGSYISPDAISLNDIPAGASFKVQVNVGVGNGNVTVQDYSTHLYYVEQRNDGFYLSSPQDRIPTTGSVDDNGLNVHIDTHPKIVENKGDAFLYSVWLGNVRVQYTGDTLLACKTIMSFSISSAYREYILSGKNAALLKAIENQLASNGQTLHDVLDAQQQTNDKLDGVIDQQEQTNDKLDGIINDKVDPEIPAGSDKVDDYQQAENELLDSVQGGSNEFDDVSINAWDRIFTYSQSFMAFGLIFKLFADIPIIQSLLYVSLTLGAFAFMLNLASSLGSSLGRSTRQRQAAVRYRVSIENRRRRHG